MLLHSATRGRHAQEAKENNEKRDFLEASVKDNAPRRRFPSKVDGLASPHWRFSLSYKVDLHAYAGLFTDCDLSRAAKPLASIVIDYT